MSQIPLYLDDATQALVEQAAETIRKCIAHERPQDCLALAGAFADFPLREESSASQPADLPRVGFSSPMLILDSNTISHYFRGNPQVVPRLQAPSPRRAGSSRPPHRPPRHPHRRHRATSSSHLVSRDTREFSCVPGLECVNWHE